LAKGVKMTAQASREKARRLAEVEKKRDCFLRDWGHTLRTADYGDAPGQAAHLDALKQEIGGLEKKR
jgi:hypothetical protein